MILSRKPLTLAEAKAYAKPSEEKRPIDEYFKTFTKLSREKSEKLAEDIVKLNNPKIREENIVKIVDLLPKDSEDINKIFVETSLNTEEANSILEIVKKY